MAIISLSEYKVYAGISGSGDDAWLTVLVSAACDAIERHCGRPSGGFELGSKTETLNGTGNEYLFPACWPIVAITSIKHVGADGTKTDVEANTYRASGDLYVTRTGVSRYGAIDRWVSGGVFSDSFTVSPSFEEGEANYEIVYNGGYSSVPAALKLAAYKLTDFYRASRGQDPSMRSESIGSYSYTRSDQAGSIPADVVALLAPWTGGGV